jgi:acyl-CoA thioesterase FadM
MGLLHAPRVLKSIVNGWMKRVRTSSHHKHGDSSSVASTESKSSSLIGLGPKRPYIYEARARLLLDYFVGDHMNNAAYLSHAELARWELLSYNGLLFKMLEQKTTLIVASTTVRYRREIRPLYCKFQVESFFAGWDQRTLWAIHNFRVREGGGDGRIRAQVLVPCVLVQKAGKVIDPRIFLKEAGLDAATIDELSLVPRDGVDEGEDKGLNDPINLKELSRRYEAVQGWMREYASKNDG